VLPVAAADGPGPDSAIILDFHPQSAAVDLGADGEMTTGLA